MTSQKPYFIRAIYEWCCDNGFTPFIAMIINEKTQVPSQYSKQSQLVLNIAQSATQELLIDNEWITFKATFGGSSHDIAIPVANILAVFAQENGQGMQFTTNLDNEPEAEIQSKKSGLKLVK